MPTIRVQDVAFHYELSGPEGAPCVMFSNSLGSAINMWDRVAPAIENRYRCLRYDTRGHGSSGTFERSVTVDDLADDLTGLMDALGIAQAHIVGLSLGGMTGQSLGFRHPERVLSLSLIATSAYVPPLDFWQKRAASVRAGGTRTIADSVMERWFTEGFRRREPAAVEAVKRSLLAADAEGYARCAEAIGAMDFRERLASIAAATLVVVGADDPVTTPAMAEVLRSGIPGADLIVLSNCAHLVSVEQAEALTGYLLAFLDRHAIQRKH